MKQKSIEGILLVALLLFAILFIGFFAITKPTITGIVIYDEVEYTLNWTFDDSSDYVYDSSLMDITDGKVTLVANIIINSLNTTNEMSYVVVQVIYDGEDQTDKIVEKDDGKRVKVNKNNIFDVTFSNSLQNGDTINFYLTTDPSTEATDIYLCDANASCTSPGYGSVYYDNTDGWFSITISGLSTPTTTLNIDPAKVNFDYINATHLEIIQTNSTDTKYPQSASIETKDIPLTSLSSFLNFYKNDLLNDQNIDYSYSIDSGNSWNNIPSNDNLSGVSVSNSKIKIKADISSNGTETPVIYDFGISYLSLICNENWNVTYGSCQSGNITLKYYIDRNECGTTNNLPSDDGTYESCVYYVVKNETSNIANTTKILVDKRTESDVLLELITSGLTNISVSIVEYTSNSKNTSPSSTELGKYIDIVADDLTKQNLTTINIKIYYTDEEIVSSGLDEDTLKIHYFNDTNNQWQVLNSTVNTTGNYVEVTIEHLSTFGIFGDKKASPAPQSSGSSSSSGGGGSSSSSKIIKQFEEPKDEEIIEETEETVELVETKICDYKISVSLTEHISFVESDSIEGIIKNIGNCEIEYLNIDISPELKDIIRIPNELIQNIGIDESIEFILFNKLDPNNDNFLIQGFNVIIPKENIKTYSGVLTFGAVIQEQLEYEEKINVKVDLLDYSTTENIVNKKTIFLVIFLLLVVTLSIFYVIKKNRI